MKTVSIGKKHILNPYLRHKSCMISLPLTHNGKPTKQAGSHASTHPKPGPWIYNISTIHFSNLSTFPTTY